ncbi:lipoprotein N-acyltransferase Lnb domain-containing protein [Altibacter lentus]|uniref:lipoprotein N-acyltransferase Lnb domain-containing protein n=1 Tax=Altibacter lentus TaxID=1223410 RepID=UPI00054FC049|nr:DUF4105 domain-containing protein [Altibacter lentus]
MKKLYLLALCLCLKSAVFAQSFTLSEAAEVSILTIGPGKQLYDKFGHSAFRINDPANGLDIVYNYGVYDFDTPNFYTKFARGKLLYKLGVSYYEPFLNMYIAQNRWVKEQTLDLPYEQKRAVFNYLQENALPENQHYKYDFFYDNCATKIRDVLVASLGDAITYPDSYVDEPHTFRELIQQNVHWNSWGSLGMDVAIGAVVDVEASPWEHQFLPDYIFKAASAATISNPGGIQPLVAGTETLFQNTPQQESTGFFTSPLFVFILIALFILMMTVKDIRKKSRCRRLDAIVFFSTGLIGFFLLLLWLATDHTATANNYNMLWAFPVNLLLAVFIARKSPPVWLRRYIIFLLLLLIMVVIHWFTGVQEFAYAFIPLFIAMAVRYVFVIGYLKRVQEATE